MLKQKLFGLVVALVGIASIPIEWDATAALVMIPIGIHMIVSKERYI